MTVIPEPTSMGSLRRHEEIVSNASRSTTLPTRCSMASPPSVSRTGRSASEREPHGTFGDAVRPLGLPNRPLDELWLGVRAVRLEAMRRGESVCSK
eukprot:CAMPEP_0195654164 /NCGR_PEP_ID=MMETSP0815-20121206/33774_1 /TAXON_ID=97485 /ORGANISM="Prymnesium parvum, Strain Texoma1" /LENGTH=95 /DNA_ID=CAMNT_0040798357 /DNA_START=217 /DNA_END=501 /DNA_ORIENTATION=+